MLRKYAMEACSSASLIVLPLQEFLFDFYNIVRFKINRFSLTFHYVLNRYKHCHLISVTVRPSQLHSVSRYPLVARKPSGFCNGLICWNCPVGDYLIDRSAKPADSNDKFFISDISAGK